MITVTTLPECASFIRFEDGFEIWKGISGKIYRKI
jgi:hypothetical protein